ETQSFFKVGSQIVMRLFHRLLALVGWFGGRGEGQRELVGTAQCGNEGALDMRSRKLVHPDDEVVRNPTEKFLQLDPSLLRAHMQHESHLHGDWIKRHARRRHIVDMPLARGGGEAGKYRLGLLEYDLAGKIWNCFFLANGSRLCCH